MCRGVYADTHLCVMHARRGQSAASHRSPALIFFLRQSLQLELELTNLARLAGQGAPERYSCLHLTSVDLQMPLFFFLMWALDIKLRSRSLLSKRFPLSHPISPHPDSYIVPDVSSSLTFLSGCTLSKHFTELFVSFFPIWITATMSLSHGKKLAKGIRDVAQSHRLKRQP